MDSSSLSPGALKKARKHYYSLAFFNVLSFQLITGNIITLFALRLGAANSFIGLISSFLYVSLFFLFIGRLLVARFGIVRLMGTFYVLRYLLFIPMPLAAFFAAPATRGIAFTLMLLASAGFNIARGIAIISDSPIVANLSGTKDRGIFFSKIQIITQVMAIVGAIFMATVLGDDTPLWRFVIIIIIGISSGLIGSSHIFKLPEPGGALKGAEEKILHSIRTALTIRNSRVFFSITFLVNATAAMFGSFLVVFLKTLYAFPDNRLVLYSALANIGALGMAVLSGFTMDRIGSKPLLFTFTFVGLLAVFVAIISPELHGLPLMVFAGSLFFLWGMGVSGMGNACLSYFIGFTDVAKRLNYGLIYYFIVGAGGTVGSILGGISLDFLGNTLGLPASESFRLYFSVIALAMTAILIGIQSLENAGSYPIRDAIMFILSPRDMRALTLLRRLDTAGTVDRERRVIRELQSTPSRLAMDGVMHRLRSPSFQIRSQALEALAEAPLNTKARRMLLSEVKNNAYTTGSMAARIIGERGIQEGIPNLHRALYSPDNVLAGESMVALAKLKDPSAPAKIEAILRETHNPRLIIYSVRALEQYHLPSSLPVLMGKLHARQAPYIRDEIILALSGFFDMSDWFYPRFVAFLEKSSVGIAMLCDDIKETFADEHDSPGVALLRLVEVTQAGEATYRTTVQELLQHTTIELHDQNASPILLQCLKDLPLSRLPRFRYFLSSLIVKTSIEHSRRPGHSTTPTEESGPCKPVPFP
jgi:MFS family permease